MQTKQRVGIVGFGLLGQYLAKAILEDSKVSAKFELVFVWNRTLDKFTDCTSPSIPKELILEDLNDFPKREADLIVEVCHPQIIVDWGERFLQHADLLIGSPTSLADADLESRIRKAASHSFGVFIPSGALWGADDIEKMGSRGTLGKLCITMKKHPASLKLEGVLLEKLNSYANDLTNNDEFVIYSGPVRDLCPLAPNNVNTMACAALAGHNLGFDKVQARLVADRKLEGHVIDIDLEGKSEPGTPKEDVFSVHTSRYNPAKPGAVTGSATYVSFLSSLLRTQHRGCGVHFC